MSERLNMRIMALDYGARTVGVALADPLGITAQGLEVIRRKDESKLRRTLARLGEIISEYEVERIVLGLPLNMDDTIGERAMKTLAFKEKLERRFGLAVALQDERLTTFEAQQKLDEIGKRRNRQKACIDMIAAVIILQDYMAASGS